MDNFSGHGKLEELQKVIPSWLTLEFLPENTTSVIQPQDGGIIARLKRLYRGMLLKLLLDMSDEDVDLTVDGFIKAVKVLHACNMAVEAWKQIDAEAIDKVWKRTLLVPNTLFICAEGMSKARKAELEDLERQVREALVSMSSTMSERAGVNVLLQGMGESMAREFIDVWLNFDEAADGDDLTIEQACDAVRVQKDDEGEEEESDVDVEEVMAHAEARRRLRDLIRYFEHTSSDFNDLIVLNGLMAKININAEATKVQRTIEDYFGRK